MTVVTHIYVQYLFNYIIVMCGLDEVNILITIII